MVICRAEEKDMAQIMALVTDVFTGEQGIPAEMHPIARERQPVWWCLCDGERIAGAAAAYLDEGRWQMGRICIAPDVRGCGWGEKLLRHALGDVFAMGADEVHMEARDATVRIVLRLGGEIAGAPFAFFGADCTPLVVRREKFQ